MSQINRSEGRKGLKFRGKHLPASLAIPLQPPFEIYVPPPGRLLYFLWLRFVWFAHSPTVLGKVLIYGAHSGRAMTRASAAILDWGSEALHLSCSLLGWEEGDGEWDGGFVARRAVAFVCVWELWEGVLVTQPSARGCG